ncbi:MAG: HAMP domain-containing protein [Caldilineae bacterium]|nr:HAMP domain-containing protein [Anaerolineae bacterium]MCB9152438.1 HAMP domain-containing protein [Caldilineae bacterium]
MRSLTLKLTLAFLFVGLIGALLVAVFVGVRTQREFDQFITDRYQQDMVQELESYYSQNGGWDNISAIAMRTPGGFVRAPVALVDTNQAVLLGTRHYRVGQTVSDADLRRSLPIEVDGQVVGRLVLDLASGPEPGTPYSPETAFLERVNQAIVFGALGATIIALALGILLARAISRPVKELTEATQRVSRGDLGHQVPVRTEDELGQLAASFNQMSIDLATSNQLRRQMTADVAHELRTPLSVILGYTEALADGKLQGKPGIYDAMYGEAQLLSHLVDDLRTLSLADAGELALNRAPMPPLECLERTAAAHAALAAQRNVHIDVQASPDLPLIDVDRERIAQILGNLVSNALRYTPEGGNITLSARAAGNDVILQVNDNGPGIDPEHLPFIFKRFYRADESRPANGESGLGLAIAHSLVEAHGGTIRAGNGVDGGAVFTISLPASQTPDEAALSVSKPG